jgi:hypothetical protein
VISISISAEAIKTQTVLLQTAPQQQRPQVLQHLRCSWQHEQQQQQQQVLMHWPQRAQQQQQQQHREALQRTWVLLWQLLP